MPTPTRSWREITGWIPARAQASIRGVVGKQARCLTPSRFSTAAMASIVCTVSLPCVAHAGTPGHPDAPVTPRESLLGDRHLLDGIPRLRRPRRVAGGDLAQDVHPLRHPPEAGVPPVQV